MSNVIYISDYLAQREASEAASLHNFDAAKTWDVPHQQVAGLEDGHGYAIVNQEEYRKLFPLS